MTMLGARVGMRVDPDHARGGIDESRRATGSSRGAAPAWPAAGEPFADGIGGARSAGNGFVRRDAEVLDAAAARARSALSSATTGIPPLTAAGDLPAGVHAASMGEFASRFGGTARRRALLGQLDTVAGALRAQGVEQIVVGGSMVSSKAVPGDVDLGYLRARPGMAGAVRSAMRELGDAASDVYVYPLDELLVEAPSINVRPGINVLEFFQRTRASATRGVALLNLVKAVR